MYTSGGERRLRVCTLDGKGRVGWLVLHGVWNSRDLLFVICLAATVVKINSRAATIGDNGPSPALVTVYRSQNGGLVPGCYRNPNG